MATITRVTAGEEASIDDLNQLIELLEGTTGYSLDFLLRALTATDFKIRLADAAGARKFIIQDSAGVTVASIDSDGFITGVDLSITGAFTLPAATGPSQTAEGSVVWDSDDDVLTVGTGAATKRLGLTRGAGSDATATAELVYDTTAAALKVWNGSASVDSATDAFASTRALFRANRRLVAEYSAQSLLTAGNRSPSGIGFITEIEAAGELPTTISGEPIQRWAVAAASTTRGLYSGTSGGSVLAAVSPNHSPRMLMRVQWPAASANLTFINAGFWTTQAATAEGAFLRIVTTGNVFFVTDNGGTETATDLGVLSRTTILGYEIETADAGVTWVCRDQAGTVLATHTTNVPTVTTALAYGITGTMAATLPYGVAYARVEATFA